MQNKSAGFWKLEQSNIDFYLPKVDVLFNNCNEDALERCLLRGEVINCKCGKGMEGSILSKDGYKEEIMHMV